MTTQFLVEQVDGATLRVAASVLRIDTDKQRYEFGNGDETAILKLPMREVKAITTPPQIHENASEPRRVMRSG